MVAPVSITLVDTCLYIQARVKTLPVFNTIRFVPCIYALLLPLLNIILGKLCPNLKILNHNIFMLSDKIIFK